jgi:ATP-dependent DNA ligase
MHQFISRDGKGKIRVVEMKASWDELQKAFAIYRTTYQYEGKKTEQPTIYINQGKAARTLKEQVDLEYKSNMKKYLDKGYKLLEKPIEQYSEQELHEIIGDVVTDSSGFAKHMLAKQADKVKDSSIEKVKCWAVSRKIDGVRCSFYWKDGEVKSASRGGGDYDPSTYQLREHPVLIELLSKNPEWILDGELYKHGKSLQQISGAARMEKTADGCDWLEYYIYDVMIPDVPFSERLKVLETIAFKLNLGFNPEREWENDELRIQIVPHEIVAGNNKKDQIMKLHNQYVAEGWEGCVARDVSKTYKYGGRGQEMIKFKMYQDAEFEITGISEGLRPEDMCFTLKTEDGIEFKAKPMGSRELKEQYREDLDKLIGKMATVKSFYLSDEGTPLQPVLKAARDYD